MVCIVGVLLYGGLLFFLWDGRCVVLVFVVVCVWCWLVGVVVLVV